MLELVNINKSYTKEVLKDINFEFKNNGIYFIKGESGKGKTTLLNIIAGFIKPDEGYVKYNNKIINSDEFDDFRKENITFLFQDYGIIDEWSIKDNLLLPEMVLSKQSSASEMLDVLSLLNLDKKLDEKCVNLSGGEKQRIAIGRIMLMPKNIILLDEPSSSIDENNIKILFDILKKLSKHHLVIIVSHNSKLINEYADVVFDLNENLTLYKNNLKDVENINDYKFVSFNIKSVFKCMINSLKNRFNRYLICSMSLIIGIIFAFLSVLFPISIESYSNSNFQKYIDYNRIQISIQETNQIEGSNLTLINSSRPSLFELEEVLNDYNYHIEYNIDYLFSTIEVKGINENIQCEFKPIHHMDLNHKYKHYDSLLKELNYNQVFVNKSFYNMIKSDLTFTLQTKFLTYNSTNYAMDTIVLNDDLIIVDVVDEFDFLMMPTVYYSYSSWVNYLENKPMINASKLLGRTISFYDRFSYLSNEKEDVSSYSFDVYIDSNDILSSIKHLKENNYYVQSFPIENTANLNDILNSLKVPIYLFCFILIGTIIFLQELIAYSFVFDRKREIGLLNAYGVEKKYINTMFFCENLLQFIISWGMAIIVMYTLIPHINQFILLNFSLSNLFIMPNMLFVISSLLICLVIAFMTSLLPTMLISKMNVRNILLEE